MRSGPLPATRPFERGFFGPSDLNYRVLASGTSVPGTAWTTVYEPDSPKNIHGIVEYIALLSTTAETRAYSVGLLRPDGTTTIELWRVAVTTAGDRADLPADGFRKVIVPKGWALQMKADNASNSTHYAVFGREVWVP